ncbi:MAG: ribosome small subunit-dependent GTPase A [Chloroflexota bacterium]|nr:ribosome small subunit-dependent GTPase A [Chloroflexota bacterium]
MTDNSTRKLRELGWNSFFQNQFKLLQIPGSEPARVFSERKQAYQVYSRHGELSARISGKLRHRASMEGHYPAVGDWVVIKPQVEERKCIIHDILPRKTKFSRKVVGSRTEEQVVAANVDTVFVVNGLDGGRNFNLRRIERYLTLTWSSGASPVIVLNKVDLCPDVDEFIRDVELVASGVHIHAVSATEGTGLDALMGYLTRGKTAAFLGPSGVGKSALINALLGIERQVTGEVRVADHKGRHTTSWRELFLLPSGGAVIDTPGMREIQMWADEDDLQNVFYDIEALAEECRFNDCQHYEEPGCAVTAAIERGDLDATRLESYRKLQRELRHLASREEQSARLEEKARWKKISQWVKETKTMRKHL